MELWVFEADLDDSFSCISVEKQIRLVPDVHCVFILSCGQVQYEAMIFLISIAAQ